MSAWKPRSNPRNSQVFLQAVSLGLGAVVIGAFDDREVGRIVRLPPAEALLLLLPVGKPASGAEEEEGKF